MTIGNLDVSRRRALALISTGAASLGAASSVLAAAGADAARPILGSEAQIEADRIVLRLLQDDDVEALRDKLRAELSDWPRGRRVDGQNTLEHAILLWTAALAFEEMQYLQRENPVYLIGTDDTPHTWFGLTISSGIAGDNPDAIYRSTMIDGHGEYEIVGQLDPRRPSAQVLFNTYTGRMAHPAKIEKGGAPNPDAGIITLVGSLGDQDLVVAPDGAFRIKVGGAKKGPNYLATKPEPMSVGLRQMVLDWTTPPLRLQINRLDKAPAKPLDVAELKRAVLADLPGFVGFWAKFADNWLGGIAVNTITQPAPRTGGWGFIGGLNFRLDPGKAALEKLHPGKAKYMGFQLTDPWTICPDNAHNQSCLNLAQSTPDADGGFTYIISPVDPGVANWLDTCGLAEGFGHMRWQNFPVPTTDNKGLLQDFRIIDLSEVAALPGVARVTPEQRSRILAARVDQYYSRYRAI
jgi:hypothetical protein